VRLLYLSCHEILEFDEISLFRGLGNEVFSAGSNSTAGMRNYHLRPSPVNGSGDSVDMAAYQALAKSGRDPRECLTREFVDRFDAILVMHMPHWIVRNWEVMRHRTVIWRTIGQSSPEIELTMQSYRSDGLRIVRYSPAERCLANYAGEDALIRFYKDPDEWCGWTGEKPVVVCVSQSMPRRPVECNYGTFLNLARGLPFELYGPRNEDAGPVWRGCLSYEELRRVLRTSRACFHAGTFPASYTLGFIEAWMTGIPVVAIGQRLFCQANASLSGLYEIPQLIEHEVNGFVSDDVDELRSCLQCLLTHEDYAREVSQAGRDAARRFFDKATVLEQWRCFFAGLPHSE
jgi:hypothetical protein